MKKVLFILLPLLLHAQVCIPSNISGCTNILASGGDQTGTVPLITCPVGLFNVSYSSLGNSAARKADVCFIKFLANNDNTHCITLSIHGGGDNSGDQHGDFSIGSTGGTGWFVSMEQGGCPTIVSLNYTLVAGGLGTNAPYPPNGAPIQDILCGLHWIGHNAGVNFPGNPADIRIASFSWGSQLAMIATWNPGGYTSVCEYSDSYKIHGINVITGPVYNISGQWATGQDGTFIPAIKAAFNCTSACDAAATPYDNHLFIGATKPMFAFIEGSTDTITNPASQGAQAMVDFAALGVPFYRRIDSGQSHGAACKNTANFIPTECWKLVVEINRDTKPSITSGASASAGGSAGF